MGGRNDMQGDETQRREAARDAREKGKRPSEVSATTGASKQPKKAKSTASHQERIEMKDEGKPGPGTSGKPRPGNRDTDPKRTNRWG